MKTPHAPFLAILICNLLLITSIVKGQSVTINSISGSSFCSGDPISVTFTATGTWGHKNAFTLQLSNDTGLFDNGFQNLGSIQDTIAGTYTIYATAPSGLPFRRFSIYASIYEDDTSFFTNPVFDTSYDTTLATLYRLRVIGANPYIVSADNGSNVVISPRPSSVYVVLPSGDDTLVSATPIGKQKAFPVQISNFQISAPDTLYWTFGDGSDPATEQTIYYGYDHDPDGMTTYSTPGLKMIKVTAVAPGGCSKSDTTYTRVYDCSPQTIPHNAIVISNDTTVADSWNDTAYANNWGDTVEGPKTFWVNPGVTLHVSTANGSATYGTGNDEYIPLETWDTIFAEAGTNIIAGGPCIVYLKPGATATTCSFVVYSEGASVTNCMQTLQCDSFSFNYSVAPPNSIMHINDGGAGVAIDNTALEQIALSPNPTNGIVAVQGVPVSTQVQVMNVLGVAVQEMARTMEPNFTLDLSKLAPGTYYIRFSSANSVVTKKVMRE